MVSGPARICTATWSGWWTKTSISGVSNAGNAKHLSRRICWMVIFIVLLVLTIYAVIGVFATYIAYPVETAISLKRFSNIDFPSVTVCNQNRVDCTRVMELIDLCDQTPDNCSISRPQALDTIKKIKADACPDPQPAAAAPAPAPVPAPAPSPAPPPPSGRKKRQTQPPAGQHKPRQDEMGEVPADIESEYKFLKDFMTLDEAERQLIGHEFDDFVKSCTFRERSCLDANNFWLTNSPNFGNCYTFNSGLNEADAFGGERVASMTGPNFGLSLVLNIEQHKYMANGQTKQAGARLVVHDEDVRPLTDESGIDLHPNTLTRIPVHEIAITRMPEPYVSNCTDHWDLTNYTDFVPFEKEVGLNYSLALCSRVCLQDAIQTDCECFHPLFLDSDKMRNEMKPCDLREGNTESDCVFDVMYQLDNSLRNCSCEVDCTETDYELSISESKWPSLQYQTSAQTAYGFDSDDAAADKMSLAENLLQVQIYFTSLNVQVITESAVYDWNDSSMVAAIGGALSLYLGISISMIFEVIELFLDFFHNTFLYCKGGSRALDKVDESKMDHLELPASRAVTPVKPFPYEKPT